MLIGGECYHELHTGQRKPIGDGLPLLVETRFGWTVTGKVPTKSTAASTLCCFSTTCRSIPAAAQRSLMLEAVEPKPSRSAKQRIYENSSTPTRTHNGRYTVFLPRSKDPQVTLGNSRESVARRVNTHESFHKKDPPTKPTKKACLSHMRKNDNTKPHCSSKYPHVSSVQQADLRSSFDRATPAVNDPVNAMLERQPEAQLANQPPKRTCRATPSKPYEPLPLRKRAEAERSCPVPVNTKQKKSYKQQYLYEGKISTAGEDLPEPGYAESTKIGRAVRNMLNAKWECEQVSTVPFAPPPIVWSTGSFAVPDDARESSQPPPRVPETTKTGRALRNCSMRIRNANW